MQSTTTHKRDEKQEDNTMHMKQDDIEKIGHY
jgi:hypothetical protein